MRSLQCSIKVCNKDGYGHSDIIQKAESSKYLATINFGLLLRYRVINSVTRAQITVIHLRDGGRSENMGEGGWRKQVECGGHNLLLTSCRDRVS